MKLITLNVDESILEELLEKLKSYPSDKLKVNDEPVLDDITMEDIINIEDEDEYEDYFMINEDEEIMDFEVELNEDPDYDEDGTTEVDIIFENGRRYFGFVITMEEVSEYIEDDDYYFSGFVIVKQVEHSIVKNAIIDMIERRDFFEAFDDYDNDDYDDDDYDTDLDDIDPVRRN